MQNSWIVKVISIASAVGIVDAGYLSYEHFTNSIPPCSLTSGCETVLTSQYAELFGLPVALYGLIFYVIVLTLSLIGSRMAIKLLLIVTSIAFVTSLGLLYLQAFVIESFCMYCLLSAALSTTLFLLSVFAWRATKKINTSLAPSPNQNGSGLEKIK